MKVFEPFKINQMELKNRMVVSAMVTNYCSEEDVYKRQTFIYKTGIQDEIKEAKKKFVAKAYEQKEKDTEMYSFSSNDQNNMCTNDNGNINRNIHGNHCSNGANRDQCGTGSTLKCCDRWSSSDRRFLFWR